MTLAVSGKGTILEWNGSPVAELTSISGPTETMDTIDVTSHDSADAYREFIAGLRDGGDISFEGNFIKSDTGQIAMHTDFQNGAKRTWTIKQPGAGAPQVSGEGYITALSMSYPFEDKISITGTIKVTGKPTLTV